MKRILIFSLAYYPRFVGGAEVAIKEITDRLGDEYEFDMITLRKHAISFERIGKVNVYRVGFPWKGERTASSRLFPLSKILFPLLAVRKALKLHQIKPYDAIWGMMAAYAGLAALLFKLRRGNVPFLLTLQEGDPISHIKRRALPIYPFFRRIFARADMLQAISGYLADFGRDMGFKGPLVIIPNGVDIARFKGESVAHQGIVLVTASRLVWKNGIDTVIRALPLLPPEIRFRVFGEGPDRASLEALAHELGVAGRVEFKGFIDHSELPSELHASDIFIRPSRSEGMGNSFIEAFAAGLPVIATQEGGIQDFLFDRVRNPEKTPTGWAVDTEAPAQIVAAVKEILRDPARTRAVTENARRLAEASYDWDHIVRNMKERVFGPLLETGYHL